MNLVKANFYVKIYASGPEAITVRTPSIFGSRAELLKIIPPVRSRWRPWRVAWAYRWNPQRLPTAGPPRILPPLKKEK